MTGTCPQYGEGSGLETPGKPPRYEEEISLNLEDIAKQKKGNLLALGPNTFDTAH